MGRVGVRGGLGNAPVASERVWFVDRPVSFCPKGQGYESGAAAGLAGVVHGTGEVDA